MQNRMKYYLLYNKFNIVHCVLNERKDRKKKMHVYTLHTYVCRHIGR